jgi:hypothetical protein
MRICGCEISAQEVRLAVVQLNDEKNVGLLRIKKTRIKLKDDIGHIALLFNSGNGVEKNQITAFLLAYLSVHNGYENGQILLNDISKKMKRSELLEAKKITQEFIKTHYTLLDREQLEKLEQERLEKTTDLEKDPREGSPMNKFFAIMFDNNRNKPEGGWAAYWTTKNITNFGNENSDEDEEGQVADSTPNVVITEDITNPIQSDVISITCSSSSCGPTPIQSDVRNVFDVRAC